MSSSTNTRVKSLQIQIQEHFFLFVSSEIEPYDFSLPLVNFCIFLVNFGIVLLCCLACIFLTVFQVCSAFCLAIFYKMYIAFGVCSLLMEVNSIFLHFRQLLNFHGVTKTSLLYQVNGILLLVTFVNFRFLTSAWMTNFVIQNRNELPFWHFMLSAVGMAVVTVLNISVFMQLWRSDFKREQTKQRDD